MKNNYKWPVTAKVVKENEIPVLKVNGETLPTLGFYGNVSFCGSCEAAMPFFETVSHSYENGNRLFIVAIETDLATKESKDMLDESARRILERAPDSYIIFRVSARVGADCESLPPVPEEDMQLRYGGGSNDWLSLGSKVWRQRVEIVYTDIINYIREQDYACRVIGFQIMNAKSGEWVFSNVDLDHSDDYSISERAAFREWLKAKYESNVALQTAWDDKDVTFENAEIPTPDERALTNGGYFHDIMKGSSKVVDWNLFYNEAYADGIIYCCNLVKHLTGGNVITGVMYGYLWSYICYPWPVSTGAFALTKVLKSGVCDSISSPTNYGSRALGCGNNSMSLVETMNLNNIIFTTEDDTRTFLTSPDALRGDFPQNLTHTFDESMSVLRRNFGYVTARGAGLYWMDLISAGWYNTHDLWREFADLRSIWTSINYKKSKNIFEPQIALIFDDYSVSFCKSGTKFNPRLTQFQYSEIVNSGVSYATYMLEDLPDIPDSCKIIILMNSFVLDEKKLAKINALKRDGKTIIFVRATGITREDLQTHGYENVSEVTGINMGCVDVIPSGITVITNPEHVFVKGTGVETFGKGPAWASDPINVEPGIYVDDKDAIELGKFADSDYVSFALKKQNGWISVFAGSGVIPATVLRAMAVNTYGVNSFIKDASATPGMIECNNQFVVFHPNCVGEKELTFPHPAHIVDLINHKLVGDDVDTINFNSEYVGQTEMFSFVKGVVTNVNANSNAVVIDDKWTQDGDAIVTDSEEATVEYTFNGKFISLTADVNDRREKLSVTLDGMEYPFVSLYAKENGEDCEFIIAQELPNTEHKLILKSMKTDNGEAVGKIKINKFTVIK